MHAPGAPPATSTVTMLNLRILSTLVLLLGLAAVTKTSKTATFENDRKDECFKLFKELAEKEGLELEDFTIEKRKIIVDCVEPKKTQHDDCWIILYRLADKTNKTSGSLNKHDPVERLQRALRKVYEFEVEVRRVKDGNIATFENDRKDECFNLFKEMAEKENLKPEDFTIEKKQLIVDCVRAKKTQYDDRKVIFSCLANKTDDMYIPKSEPLEEDYVKYLKYVLRNVYEFEVEIRRVKYRNIATFENDRKDECLNLFKEMAEKEDLKPEDFTIEKKQLIVDCVKSKKTQSDDCEAILKRLTYQTDGMWIPKSEPLKEFMDKNLERALCNVYEYEKKNQQK